MRARERPLSLAIFESLLGPINRQLEGSLLGDYFFEHWHHRELGCSIPDRSSQLSDVSNRACPDPIRLPSPRVHPRRRSPDARGVLLSPRHPSALARDDRLCLRLAAEGPRWRKGSGPSRRAGRVLSRIRFCGFDLTNGRCRPRENEPVLMNRHVKVALFSRALDSARPLLVAAIHTLRKENGNVVFTATRETPTRRGEEKTSTPAIQRSRASCCSGT